MVIWDLFFCRYVLYRNNFTNKSETYLGFMLKNVVVLKRFWVLSVKRNPYFMRSSIYEMLPLRPDQRRTRSELELLNYDRGYDYLLLGQGFRHAQGSCRWIWSNYGIILKWGEADKLCETRASMPLSPLLISAELIQDWTRNYTVRCHRLASSSTE